MSIAVAGLALEPTTPLANFGRQSWVMENGLPQNAVQALAQTRDGYIWIGTEVGLARFDGNGFAVFDRNSTPALPGNDVRCLLAASDGALWIGTSEGLARLKEGSATSFTTRDGLPENSILAIAEASDGAVWAYTGAGLARQAGRQFNVKSFWLPGSKITAVSKAGQRSVWLDPGLNIGNNWNQPEPVKGKPVTDFEFLADLTNGDVAAGDLRVLFVTSRANKTTSLTVGKELSGSRIQALLADREGSLWIGTNRGLVRWVGGKLERLPLTDPLASASILALMEDREGNLWAGTETDGLHILRDQRFRTFGAREGLSSDAVTTVVEDKAGALWVGTSGGGLNVLERAGGDAGSMKVARTYTVRDGLASDVILSLAAAPDGDIWAGTPDGLSRIHGGRVDSFSSADGLPDDFIRSLLADADGSLWVGTRHGLTHWTGAAAIHLETFTQSSGLGSDLVGAMARDSNGDLWVATFAGLSRLAHGKIVNYTIADGLSSNVITALLPRAMGTLLIGTQDHGWNVWDGHHFSRVTNDEIGRTSIHAMLDDGLNHLWFATGNGIARCDLNDSASGMKQADCAHWMEFGAADGLRSAETAINSHPSAWRSQDGHLWFATPKGLVEVDPAHFPANTIPPPVELERFSVDDVDQALHAGGTTLEIGAGHVHFQFDYAGLSFTAPQKVRCRYMLEGFDRDWTDAGARRAAYYTAIPHGHYTFRVQAANNDGVWNLDGAALQFNLRPHFYQTLWFYMLLLGAAAGLVLLLLRLRVRSVEREFRAVLGERNRIAREIHDTLAQGYVGISVQLEVLAELLRMKKVDAAAEHLDTTRGHVREGLADARQSIWALRSQDTGENTLPVRLRRMVEAAGGRGLDAECRIHGAYRPLAPGTEREFLRVAQEALHNVNRHAGAKHVFVELEYGAAAITLAVRDDGRGFEAGEPLESPPGHFGLTGMRERAAAIGGTLEVTSEPGAGTTVRLEMPAPREQKENH